MKRILAVVAVALVAIAGPPPAHAAGSYDQFVRFVNRTLDGLENDHGGSNGWELGRGAFDIPSVARQRWVQVGLLCSMFDLKADDGSLTRSVIRSIAKMIWKGERTFVDRAAAAGASTTDIDDLMAVNFTVLSAGVHVRCPHWDALMLGRLSDTLYQYYDTYAHVSATNSIPVPAATPIPATTASVVRPAAPATNPPCTTTVQVPYMAPPVVVSRTPASVTIAWTLDTEVTNYVVQVGDFQESVGVTSKYTVSRTESLGTTFTFTLIGTHCQQRWPVGAVVASFLPIR
jgi:hypothetical protein